MKLVKRLIEKVTEEVRHNAERSLISPSSGVDPSFAYGKAVGSNTAYLRVLDLANELLREALKEQDEM